ncbi:MAG: hypothetical protein ACI9EW_004193 [Cellvibrionaceae bacterium]|jgi:hypothetical protein
MKKYNIVKTASATVFILSVGTFFLFFSSFNISTASELISVFRLTKDGPTIEDMKQILVVPATDPGESFYTKLNKTELTETQQENLFANVKASSLEGKAIKGIAIYLPDSSVSIEDNLVAFQVLSSIKYTLENDLSFQITVALPSKAAAQRNLILGNNQITLSNGTNAGVTFMEKEPYPNQVMFIDEDRIITINGNAPMEMLIEISSNLDLR